MLSLATTKAEINLIEVFVLIICIITSKTYISLLCLWSSCPYYYEENVFMKNLAIFLTAAVVFTSCSRRNLAYFNDVEQAVYTEEIANLAEIEIQPDDLLSIRVTSLNPESDVLFNVGELNTPRAGVDFGSFANNNPSTLTQGYLVDKQGFIDFPVLGRLEVQGMTTTEARNHLSTLLEEYLKEPLVSLRFLNFRVTVVGEVNRPTTFTIASERINVLEALGMAGDMTAFGKRENVLIIREEAGDRTLTRLDLSRRDVLQSPYFYLQQNDVVYVEPDRRKEVQASTNTRLLSVFVAAVSIVTLIVSRFN